MRNLFDIVQACRADEPVEHEELKYALLAYVSMFNIEHHQLREQLSREKLMPDFLRKRMMENSFDMYKGALNTSPKAWLGKEGADKHETN